MAQDKKTSKQDPEITRRKKEETARRSRRRTRQMLGFVLAILIVVGAVSIIGSGIDLVRGLLDDTEEREDLQSRITTMVWFDVLPFDDVGQLEPETIKQVAIWGVYNNMRDELESENEELLIPTLEVDRFARNLLGQDFSFGSHETFTEPSTALVYTYREDLEAYLLPATSMLAEYNPVVVDLVRLSGGGRRLTVGYASTRQTDSIIPGEIDYENPVKYMDFIFRRDGNEYYLVRLERNTTMEVTNPQPEANTPDEVPVLPDDVTSLPAEDDIISTSLPEDGTEPGEQDEPEE